MTPAPCARCASTSRPMELVGDKWQCLAHRRRLVLVSPEPTELEALLLASLAARGRLLAATHDALGRDGGGA